MFWNIRICKKLIIMWIDSGIVTFGNIGFVCEHIGKSGIWLTEDPDWINYKWTFSECITVMNATFRIVWF